MKLEQIKTRDAKFRNNRLFKVYKRMFYKIVKEENKKKKEKRLLKFEKFGWEFGQITPTPHKKNEKHSCRHTNRKSK